MNFDFSYLDIAFKNGSVITVNAKDEIAEAVGVKGNKIVPVPLSEVAGKLKTVPADSDIVQAARDLGLSMGD